ncbi:MAG: NADH-quinone oxidoreductase subunit L, partial [Chloroflexia bacterium]|nr:NADH-quinone oxidoreductase subunit L [Chloroflexia bacterium]
MEFQDLQIMAEQERARRKAIRIHCCTSSGCQASGALELFHQLEAAVEAAGQSERVDIVGVGCMGFCGQGPMVSVEADGVLFEHVRPEQAPEIIASLDGGPCSVKQGDHAHPFFARQLHIVRRNGGVIDPERIEEYIAVGGYQALYHVLHEMSPAEVIDAITRSGLRGRGGAGYPTGLKWATVAKSPGERKFVICNGDEGDPGAFMDRSILE